jgi:uncharacterized protein YciI
MPYLVRCYFRAGAAEQRFAVRAAHIEYVIKEAQQLVLAGAMCGDQNEVLGLFLALRCDTRAQAQAFVDDEPYFRNGLFDRVEMEKLLQFVPHENPEFLHQELLKQQRSLADAASQRGPSAPTEERR